MSHLLIVQSCQSESATQLFAQGVSLFDTLWNLQPCDSIIGETLRVCTFPRQNMSSNPITRAKSSAHWLCGSGTWFYGGLTGEHGLHRLLQDQFLADHPPVCLRDLDGQFVIASGDSDSGELVVITDRLGILHVYAAEIGRTEVISTSSIALAVIAGSAWDPEGCRQFLSSGNIFEPARTLFKTVKKLEDARVYCFADGRLASHRKYWSIAAVIREGPEQPADVHCIATALQESLCTIQKNFPRPLLDFTGGFDTRGLVGAMLHASLDLDLVVNGPDDSPDVVASTHIAQDLGLRLHHRFTTFTSVQKWWERSKESVAYCDGECDVLGYAGTLQAHLENTDGFDATVNGAIGEVLKGHWWELLFPYTGHHDHFDPYLIAARRFTFEGEIPGLLACTFRHTLIDHYADIIRQTVRDLDGLPNTVLLDAVYLLLRQQKWLGRTVSATDRILPCISPYGFRQPLELAVAAPARARIYHRMSRRLIEHEHRRLSQLPLPGGYTALPLRATTVQKFWPLMLHYSRLVLRRLLIQAKLRRDVRTIDADVPYSGAAFSLRHLVELDEVRTLLDPGQMCTRELYEPPVLRREMNNCLRECSTNAYRLGRILTLELVGRTVCAAKRDSSAVGRYQLEP